MLHTGGSISMGQGTKNPNRYGWVSLLKSWAELAFGNATSVRNSALGATPSAYFTLCLDLALDPDVDVVFSEFIL